MPNDKPEDPQAEPDDASLQGRIDKLGEDLDKLADEALPPDVDPPSVGAQLG